jgi:hypothetical protein
MSCENYREALIESAASGAAPPRELRLHLDACTSCRATFTEELQLFVAIDAGVRTTANAEVPASLLPRVRAKLNELSVPRRSWIPTYVAVAAAVALVIAIVFVRGAGRDKVEHNLQMGATAGNVVSPETKTFPAAAPIVETSAPPTKGKLRRPLRIPPVAPVEQVAVLIPAGQKQAIDAFLASVQQGKVEANVLLAEKPKGTLEELQVSPLDISPIEVKPLANVSAESRSENGKTKL